MRMFKLYIYPEIHLGSGLDKVFVSSRPLGHVWKLQLGFSAKPLTTSFPFKDSYQPCPEMVCSYQIIKLDDSSC